MLAADERRESCWQIRRKGLLSTEVQVDSAVSAGTTNHNAARVKAALFAQWAGRFAASPNRHAGVFNQGIEISIHSVVPSKKAPHWCTQTRHWDFHTLRGRIEPRGPGH